MINKIAHIADIQIECNNKLSRNDEYKTVLDNFILDIKDKGVDRLVIVGDIFENWQVLTDEKNIFINFLQEVKKYVGKIVITNGNHDVKQNDNFRLEGKTKKPLKDDIEIIVNAINDPNIIYYNKTGFYEDENIVWCVWNHKSKYHKYLEEKYSPWTDEIIKKTDKTYIELFHDPITGCVDFNDREIRTTKNINLDEFKGDLVLMGDIHKRNVYNKENGVKLIYCGSLVARNYSEGDYWLNNVCINENVEEHGYNLVEIDGKNIKNEFINIKNPYSFHTIILTEKFDYNDIDLEINPTDYNRIKVIPQHTLKKYKPELINKYIFSNYNVYPIITKDKLVYDDQLSTSTADTNFLTEIKTKEKQRDVLEEHFKEQGLSNKQIKQLLDIDDKVNQYINNTDYVYKDIKLDKINISNYKSFGDNQILDLKKLNKGIIKLVGGNEQGKTTLTDAIKTAFTGASTNTIKYWDYSKKNKSNKGLNKLINDNRKKDVCSLDMYITVNNVKHVITYLINRTWKRDKPVYFIDKDEQLDKYIKNLTLDVKVKKQVEGRFVEIDGDSKEYILSLIPSYQDYTNLIETNSDTLNDLLTYTDEQLVEYILRNIGVGFSEEKKTVFNKSVKQTLEIKSDVKNHKDFETLKADIETKTRELATLNNDKVSLKSESERINSVLEKLNDEKLELVSKLHNIDEKLLSVDISSIRNKHNEIEEEISSSKVELEKFKSYLEDEEQINKEIKVLNIFKDNIVRYNKYILDCTTKQNEAQEKKESIITYINNLMNEYHIYINDIDNRIQSQTQSITLLTNKLNNVKESGVYNKEKKEKTIELYQTKLKTLEDSKNCPVVGCNNTKTEQEIKLIDVEINKLNETHTDSINRIEQDIKNKRQEYIKIKEEIDKANQYINDIVIDTKYNKYKEIIEKYNELAIEFDKNIVEISELLDVYNNDNDFEDYNVLKGVITFYSSKITEHKNDIKYYEDQIEKGKEYQIKKQELDDIKVEIGKLKDSIIKLTEDKNDIVVQINEYEKEQYKINENNQINEKLDLKNDEITNLTNDLKNVDKEYNDIVLKINNYENHIVNVKKRVKKYQDFLDQKVIFKIYTDIMDKKGLPQIIFKKIVPIINKELMNLLEDLNFRIYFDENNVLKMIDLFNIESTQRELEDGSGMQRTFAIPAIKNIIRKYNNKFLLNYIVLDEITGKLDDVNKDLMVKVLHKLKQEIDYIFLIDQDILNEEKLLPDNKITLSKTTEGTLINEIIK